MASLELTTLFYDIVTEVYAQEIDNLATPGDSEDHLKTCLRQQNDSFWVKILNDSISMYTRWATGIEALPPCVGRSLDLPYLLFLTSDLDEYFPQHMPTVFALKASSRNNDDLNFWANAFERYQERMLLHLPHGFSSSFSHDSELRDIFMGGSQ